MIPVNSVFSVSLKFPISVECITIFIFASKHFSPKPVVPIKIYSKMENGRIPKNLKKNGATIFC